MAVGCGQILEGAVEVVRNSPHEHVTICSQDLEKDATALPLTMEDIVEAVVSNRVQVEEIEDIPVLPKTMENRVEVAVFFRFVVSLAALGRATLCNALQLDHIARYSHHFHCDGTF